MTIIKQKQKIQNIPNDVTLQRINKISKTFRSAKRGNRAKMLSALANEINQTQNHAVKIWLIKFNSILKALEVSK